MRSMAGEARGTAERRRVSAPLPGIVALVALGSFGWGLASDAAFPWLLAPWVAGLVASALIWPRASVAVLALAVVFHMLAVSLLARWVGIDIRGFTTWKEVLLLALAASLFARGAWLRPRDGLASLALALFAWASLRTALAVGSGELALGVAARGLATDASPLLLFAIARRLEWTTAQREAFTLATVAVFTACAAFGIVQLFAIGPGWYPTVGYFGPRSFQVPGYEIQRLGAISLDPLVAGYCSAVGACLALDAVARARGGPLLGWTCVVAILVTATIASFTRAAWIGLALGGMALIPWTTPPARRRLLVLAGLGLLPALPLLPAIAHRVWATLTVSDTSTPLHLERWELGARTLLEHPWGLGAGRAGEVSARMLGEARIITESSYLQFGVELGWVGMALFTAWVLAVGGRLLVAARTGVAGASGVLAAWIVMAVAGLFQHALTERAPVFALVVLAAMTLARPGGDEIR